MPTSPLESAGAAVQPIAAAPLHVNEFFTGMWTNGSPLGPGPVPYLYQRFYSASRYDRLIDGSDVEVSPRLTLIRRPGHTVYNPGPFPPIDRFYEFRGFSQTDEIIHLLADCDTSTNLLLNPNFVAGATGWGWGQDPGGGGGWSLGTGAVPIGDGTFTTGNVAEYNGTGSAPVANNERIPCAAGTQIAANCWGLGEIGADGYVTLRINFYQEPGDILLATFASAPITNDYVWRYLTVTATAPAGTTIAMIDLHVQGKTSLYGRWFGSNFSAGYAPLQGTVREVTQPNTNTILWAKDPAAGRTSFVSDGNVLYAGDGVNTHQWVTSAKAWQPNTVWQPGDFILDSNGNIQMAVGSVTANIVNIQVDDVIVSGGLHGRKVTLWFDSSTPFDVPSNIAITTSGMTTVPAANGTTPYTVVVESAQQLYWVHNLTSPPITAYSNETGTATTGSGASGSAAPSWNPTYGLVTQDGGNQWVNMGSAVLPWGYPGPTSAPTVTQVTAASIYPAWAASTWYAPLGIFDIIDSNGNIQQVTTAGQTGATGPPTWATALGAVTTDGTVQWTNQGPAAWQANHSYALGASVKVTYTYSTTTYQWTSDGHGGFIQKPVVQQVSATSMFQVTVAGMSGANQPSWNNGVNTVTVEASGLTWKNIGNSTSYLGTKQNISMAAKILDPNGYLQAPSVQAESGATAPTSWSKTLGGTTTDNTEIWLNAGSFAPAATEPWQWAYSGKNSVTGEISNASPVSPSFVPSLSNVPVIQGMGLPEPPWDTIVLWRTAAGGSSLLYDDEFPNPGAGQTWIYTDTNVDPGNVAAGSQGTLDANILAPINSQANPPPSNFVPEAYYLGRIWGYTNNVLRWTGGPDTLTGNGNNTMPPVNQFRLPSKGITCWPTSVGLICFTSTDIWAVQGQGTSSSPFYIINFQQGIGMASQDALAVNGSTAYAMLTSHQVVSMDPGAGELEVGFPIADIFDGSYDPKLTYLTWHQGRSADTALYVANGSTGWFRMAVVSAPESGNVWSPPAVIHSPGGVRAMLSTEITPGEKILVLGPNVDGNPILKRDSTVHSDAGIPYLAHATIAPVVLSQPGSTAGVQFVVTEERMVDGATALNVKMLFDEIHDAVHVFDADWRALRNRSNDPPNLPRQKSVLAQRLWAQQDPSTVIRCRWYEQDLSWAAEDYANELYTNTVYGRLPEKARK